MSTHKGDSHFEAPSLGASDLSSKEETKEENKEITQEI